MIRFTPIVFVLFAVLLNKAAIAQSFVPACVGFYNVENLFDTLDTPGVRDTEFSPEGSKSWGSERYQIKLENMAKVISELGVDVHPDGVFALGLSEIENRQVIEDLINTAPLSEREYDIVHYDSPDKRGVDVGLIYQPKYFKVFNSKSYTLTIEGRDDFFSRDQLVVSGVLETDTVHLLVAHWPSRRGGAKRSAPLRMAAGDLGRTIVDSLLAINPQSKIIYMGDLNDDPIDRSVKFNLRSTDNKAETRHAKLFNPMVELYNKGVGSLAYRDTWNLFDQMLVSAGLVNDKALGYKYYGARVYNKPYLLQKEGNFAGYPFRTFVGDTFMGGYSDHFPVYLILVRPAAPDEH